MMGLSATCGSVTAIGMRVASTAATKGPPRPSTDAEAPFRVRLAFAVPRLLADGHGAPLPGRCAIDVPNDCPGVGWFPHSARCDFPADRMVRGSWGPSTTRTCSRWIGTSPAMMWIGIAAPRCGLRPREGRRRSSGAGCGRHRRRPRARHGGVSAEPASRNRILMKPMSKPCRSATPRSTRSCAPSGSGTSRARKPPSRSARVWSRRAEGSPSRGGTTRRGTASRPSSVKPPRRSTRRRRRMSPSTRRFASATRASPEYQPTTISRPNTGR